MGNHKIGIRRVNVEKILLAAEKVFANKGYGSTAMAEYSGWLGSRASPACR